MKRQMLELERRLELYESTEPGYQLPQSSARHRRTTNKLSRRISAHPNTLNEEGEDDY